MTWQPDWKPIDTVKDGDRVMLMLEKGQKGNGEIAIGMVFRNVDKSIDHWWSWGGPNSGASDEETPTHWAELPLGLEGRIMS